MAVKHLVTFPTASLKSKAQTVTKFDNNLRQLIADMIETMNDVSGVGLAAPQIGVQLRVIVIAGQIARSGNDATPTKDEPKTLFAAGGPATGKRTRRTTAGRPIAVSSTEAEETTAGQPTTMPPLALINPTIAAANGEQAEEEGCLSVPDYSTKVKRFTRIVVKAQDIDQSPLEFVAEDFFARVIQHELDHLDGILFIDRISSLKRALYRKKIKKILQTKDKK